MAEPTSSNDVSTYTPLNANHRPTMSHLTHFYNEHAVDHSSISYTFRRDGMGIKIFVHKKIPAGKFKKLVFDFMRSKSRVDHLASEEGDVEIQVLRRKSVVEDDVPEEGEPEMVQGEEGEEE